MPNWIRRSFDATGMTTYPVGEHLSAVQASLSGAVILCVDVSWSMSGRLDRAVAGGLRFVDEAVAAQYRVGLILWDTGVHSSVPLSKEREPVRDALRAASIGGGTNIVPALSLAGQQLADRSGDKVIAIFGDGDLGDRAGALALAAQLTAKGIRIITCGLGEESAKELDTISTEASHAPRIASAANLADSVAQMATGLRRVGGRNDRP